MPNKLLVLTFMFMISQSLLAAQDYNSSRSNTTSAIEDAEEDTNDLLEKTKSDAFEVAKRMIAVERASGAKGKYKITVNVNVTIEALTEIRPQP